MQLLESVARWAWETSWAASVLIIPALLAAVVLRKPTYTPIRHMLGLLVVARLLLPFVFPSPLSIFNVVPADAAKIPDFLNARPSPLPPLRLPESISTVPAEQVVLPASQFLPRRKRYSLLTLLWAGGVIAILARVAVQHVKVRRRIGADNEITFGPGVEALRSALELSNCSRALKIYSISNLSSPALFGFVHPSILLPADLAQSGDFTRLRLVCLHEIAHLKRMDVLINWFMIFAQALHWFNPFAWLAMRRLRADQELLCDADVMRVLEPDEHRAYGETLLALASPRHYTLSTLIPVSSSFKQLKERIGMIKQFKPVTHRFLVFTLPALAAGMAIFTFTGATNKTPPAQTVEKKTASIQSEADKSEQKFEALKKQFQIETREVRELEAQVDDLRKTLGVRDLGNGEQPTTLQPETVRQMDQDRLRAGQEYAQFEKLYSTLKSKPRNELRQIIPTAYRDEALDRLLERLTQTEQQLVVAQKDYSDDHPDVVRLSTLLKTLNEQIERRIAGILEGLEAVVGARKAVVESITKQLEEAQAADAHNIEKYRPYFQAKRDLETHQKFRDTLYLRLLQANAERAIDR